jgi:sulfhydrogenase subunit delta
MSANGRPKIAFFDFTCCEGCQLTVVDSLQTHPELLEVVEIVQFREAMSEKGEDYQVAFIEGSCTRKSDETRLSKIRAQADLVVALGACAHLEARPIEAVIPVDFAIPGCPIDRDEFIACVKALLLGVKPPIPDYPVCVECKLRENTCLYKKGKVCLGPVTRAGCKAICPTYGQSCEACRGYTTNPNDESMRAVLVENGLQTEQIATLYTMFTTYQAKHGVER